MIIYGGYTLDKEKTSLPLRKHYQAGPEINIYYTALEIPEI